MKLTFIRSEAENDKKAESVTETHFQLFLKKRDIMMIKENQIMKKTIVFGLAVAADGWFTAGTGGTNAWPL
jgi:hypothetical protein